MKGFKSLKSKLALVLIAGTLSSLESKAQQEPLYSQYMFNTLAINPAYAGSRDVLSMTALGRFQWAGVPGAPTTYTYTIDMPVSQEKMGVGLQLYSDAIGEGVLRNSGAYGSYAYKVKVGARTTMSLGVQAGATFVNQMFSKVTGVGNDDVFSSANDINRVLPNVGGGIYISNDRGYIGFSVPQIIQHTFSAFKSGDGNTVVGRWQRHYYLMMGLVLGKGNVKLKPSTMIRYTPGSPLGVDGNLNLWLKDKIAFGISGRISQFESSGKYLMDAAIGMIELQLSPQLRLGYAYDFTMNRLNDVNKSSASSRLANIPTHEAMLRYEFGYGKNKILTPRYF